jgi:NAD+ diphosphatase
MPTPTLPPLGYTGGSLDRAGARRHDAGWVAAMRAHPAARLLPVWRDRSFVAALATPGASPGAAWLAPSRWRTLGLDGADGWVLLGLDGDAPVFAADLSALDEARLDALAGDGAFVDLRQVGAALAPDEAATLAYARGVLAWHRRSRHCGSCGAPTAVEHAGHMRRCTDPACHAEIYPRTDPAVIMLVERRPPGGAPQCLLARHARLPARVWSTLAGFVEPGESLEEAVAREVLEETGVRVARATYQGSQPWPFPASLMLGFRALADAETETVTIDPAELAEARWFTAAELAGFGEWGDEAAPFRFPRRDSIAHALVEAWLREQQAD